MTPALWCALATVGPVGKTRPAPGSWGSLFGVVTGFGLASLSSGLLEIAILLVIIFGTIAANHHQSETGSKDASEVVIDEDTEEDILFWVPLVSVLMWLLLFIFLVGITNGLVGATPPVGRRVAAAGYHSSSQC